jgi:NTE family protein
LGEGLEESMPNKALVLSGGGAKGSFELGVVDYLVNDLKMDFQVICGVSTGALNASMLSQGKGYEGLKEKLEELKNIWFGIRKDSDIYKKGIKIDFPRIVSLYDLSPLKDKLDEHINPKDLKSSGKEFRIGVVSLTTGEYTSVDSQQSAVRDFILASASIPFFFPPVEIKRHLFVDGGVREITPLADALSALKRLRISDSRLETDEIYIVLASPLKIRKVKGSDANNILEILKRSVEMLVSEIYEDDIKHAEEVNEYIEKLEALRGRLYERLNRDEVERLFEESDFRYKRKNQASVKITVFEPEKEYMDSLEFEPKKIRKAFEAGRRRAEEIMRTREN